MKTPDVAVNTLLSGRLHFLHYLADLGLFALSKNEEMWQCQFYFGVDNDFQNINLLFPIMTGQLVYNYPNFGYTKQTKQSLDMMWLYYSM